MAWLAACGVMLCASAAFRMLPSSAVLAKMVMERSSLMGMADYQAVACECSKTSLPSAGREALLKSGDRGESCPTPPERHDEKVDCNLAGELLACRDRSGRSAHVR